MKHKLRTDIKKIREEMTLCEIEDRSEIIALKFLKSDIYKNAKTIMSYISIKNEVSTSVINREIIRSGKRLVLPIIDEFDNIISILSEGKLVKGKYNIPEPEDKSKTIPIDEIDIIIVPGVVFDRKGDRIGFGKGYYDKFMNSYTGIKAALAFDFQIVENIESEEYDIRVDYIFSDLKNEMKYDNISGKFF